MMQPDKVVIKYYEALYDGDLETVRELMTQKSYLMMIESFGLELSLKNPSFGLELKRIEEDSASLKKVEGTLSGEIKSYQLSPVIDILRIEQNGSSRKTVYYTEDNNRKNLYFSKEGNSWKINYYAGRPIPQSYFSSIKNWIISILPSFK